MAKVAWEEQSSPVCDRNGRPGSQGAAL